MSAQHPKSISFNEVVAKRQLAGWIARCFFVRFHVLLILIFSFLIGFGVDRVTLFFWNVGPLPRYPLVVFASYLGFLFAVRVWLWYAGFGRYYRGELDLSGIDGLGNGPGNGSNSGEVLSPKTTPLGDHGGDFGGAGASAEWSGSGDLANHPPYDIPTVDLPDVGGVDVGVDEGLVVFVPIVALGFLALLVCGSAYYFFYGGPLVLAEIALEAAMAAGFFGGLQRIDSPGWLGGAINASWQYFAVLLLLATALGVAMHVLTPQAITFGDALHILF